MKTEQRGQYYFTPDEAEYFLVQKKPLGAVAEPSLARRLLTRISHTVVGADKHRGPRLEDFNWDPGTHKEMRVLRDVLLVDLESRGILDIIERLTNTPREEWYDEENPPETDLPLKNKNDEWDVEIIGPGFDYHSTPNPYGSRWSGNCTITESTPRTHLAIHLQTGEKWDERIVLVRYDRHRNLEIEGEQASKINLSEGDMRYLFGEHLRDAMKNPYNPYYTTKGGFLSSASLRRHQHELNVAREKEFAAA